MSVYLTLTVRLSTVQVSSALDAGYTRYIAVDYRREGHYLLLHLHFYLFPVRCAHSYNYLAAAQWQQNRKILPRLGVKSTAEWDWSTSSRGSLFITGLALLSCRF